MVQSNYPSDWEKRRGNVFKRDGFKCQKCGIDASEGSVKLHCHHKRHIAEGGGHGLDNLATLCEDCHYEIHSSSGPDRLDAELMRSCAYDGCCSFRPKWEMQHKYCCLACMYFDAAKEAIKLLEDNPYICSNCFTDQINPETSCSRCDYFPESVINEMNQFNLIASLLYYLDSSANQHGTEHRSNFNIRESSFASNSR